MPRWQPPHPDPTRRKTQSRQLPKAYGPQPRDVPAIDQCRWEGCQTERTQMRVLNERFALCDHHIRRTLTAIDQNAAQTAERIDRGEPTLPGDLVAGHIYYARIGDLIKIGYSTNVYRRMAQYPPGSQLLAIEPGTTKLERARHSLFRAHLSHGREWFNPNDELTAWIQRVLDTHGPPPFEHAERRRPDDTQPVVASKRMSRRW